LASELEKMGHAIQAVTWDGEDQQQACPTTYVVRSPWNYDSAPTDFLLWLEGLEQAGHQVINPASLVRWNIHKGYLLEAAARGFAIPQTALLPRGEAEIAAVMGAFAKHEYLVLKPAISLSAHYTSLVHSTEFAEHARRLSVAEREYIVQEFIPEITWGELSFIFFGGQFSHCIRKTPTAGDFRTQGDFGAARERYEPTRDEIDCALNFLTLAPRRPVFARVDLVKSGAKLLLMELELIDPMLFFGWVPEAAMTLATVIAEEVAALPNRRQSESARR
jgi:glutathione synthase/RimK-type ligase-like ATP-grasp enzyme